MSDRTSRLLPILTLCTLLAGCGGGADAPSDPAVPLYDNLGDHHYTITTSEPMAQRYFDQGLRLYYAFNHAEAIRAFNEAARLDHQCAVCYWGTALAYGPNINLPMDAAAGAAAYEALQQAQAVAEHASPKERALIDALAQRYAPDPPEDRAALDSAYSRAMQQVVDEYPDDMEARALYAESLMDLSPWQYWNEDGSPRPRTPELLAQLEHVMAADPNHPGANHFYIHAVEAVEPERAVDAAERLAGLMPGAERGTWSTCRGTSMCGWVATSTRSRPTSTPCMPTRPTSATRTPRSASMSRGTTRTITISWRSPRA